MKYRIFESMSGAEFQNTKIELAKLVLSIESEALLEKVRGLLQSNELDFWDKLSSEQRKELEKGQDDIEHGRTISLNEFVKKIS